jgi:hypothetical protein
MMSESPGNCTICGKFFKYPQQHARNIHDQYRRKPTAKAIVAMKENAATARQALEVQRAGPAASNGAPSKFQVLPFVVLEDQDGHVWIAEKIR